jgi:hypothetical protein
MQKIIDWLVPWELILLVIIVLGSFLFVMPYYWIIIFYILVGLIVLDLCLKFFRMLTIDDFFNLYIFEVILLIPFYLVFRVLERFMVMIERKSDKNTFKMLYHESLNKKETIVIKGCERIVGKRVKQMTRFYKPIQRNHKLLIAVTFYEEMQ